MVQENSMLTGICPKCGSDEVYVAKEKSVGQAAGAYGSNSIPIDWRTAIAQRNYICLTCFYTEIYAPMTEDQADRVRKNWLRVVDEHRAGKRKNE